MDIKRAKELHQRATGEVRSQDGEGNWRDSIEVGNEVLAGLAARKEIEARALAAWAVLIGAVKALEENDVAERHVLSCEDCDSGALNFCMAGQDMINAAAGAEAKVLAAWREL